MKKVLFPLLLMAAILLFAACELPSISNGEQKVSLNIKFPNTKTAESGEGRFLVDSQDSFGSIQTVHVTVSAPDLGTETTTAVEDSSGTYSATLSITKGSDRTFSAQCVGPSGAVFAQGNKIADVTEGVNNIQISMVPVANYTPPPSPSPFPFPSEQYLTQSTTVDASQVSQNGYLVMSLSNEPSFSAGSCYYVVDDLGIVLASGSLLNLFSIPSVTAPHPGTYYFVVTSPTSNMTIYSFSFFVSLP